MSSSKHYGGRQRWPSSPNDSRITAEDFYRRLEAKGLLVRMGGKGRWVDHVFVEWLRALAASPGWPSVKYQDRYLLAYASVSEALVAQVSDFRACNARRPHQALPIQMIDEMVLGTGEMNKAAQVETRLAQRVA